MRNPIRLKNLNTRYAPLYLAGVALWALVRPEPRAFWLALPLIASGLWLRGWGAGHLVKNHALTVTGPYAHLRHPLYAGTLLVSTGFALIVGGWLSILLLALLWPWFAWSYFPRKDRVESERLQALYGPAYLRYHDAVPALWPRPRPWRDPDRGAATKLRGDWRLDRYADNNELGTLLAVIAGVIVFWLRSSMELR
jgi:hypothetical protein